MKEWHGRDVERVARGGLERPDAPLAQDHVRVAARHHVLGGHQPLLDGAREAPLEQHRPSGLAHRHEQRVVLHVPRADLEDVGVLGDGLHLAGLHHLGDHRQTGPLACLGQEPQPVEAQALERVGARARLERAAAQHVRAGSGDRVGGLEELLPRLDGAWPGHDCERAIPDPDAAHFHHGVLRMERSRGQLERAVGPGHGRHARQRGKPGTQAVQPGAALAQHGNHRAGGTPVLVGRQPLIENQAADGIERFLARSQRHDDEHGASPRVPILPCRAGKCRTKKKAEACDPCFHPARAVPRGLRPAVGHAGSIKRKWCACTVPGR